MPVAQVCLVRGAFADETIGAMLMDLSQFYARTLYPDAPVVPIERVRVFVTLVEPQHWAAGGSLASEGASTAPYFTCMVMIGRRVEQHHALLEGFTEIMARHLGCDGSAVRGRVSVVEPDNWGIGGTPASIARQAEIVARASK